MSNQDKKDATAARSVRDMHKGNADTALRNLGRYLGAIIADDQPVTPADMVQILDLAKIARIEARHEGFHARDCDMVEHRKDLEGNTRFGSN